MGVTTEELPATVPADVRDRLASVRWKIRLVEGGLGAARAGLAIAFAVVVSFALDKALEPPLGLRRPFSVFVFGSALAVAGFVLLAPWRRRLDDDAVAVMVEQAHPELADALVSAVQLARSLERGDAGYTSPALIRSTIARASERARAIDFGAVVDPRPLLPAFFLTVAAFAALAAFAAVQPELARAYWRRVILGEEASYPKPIDLVVKLDGRVVEGRELAIASGDDITVDVEATRGASRIEKIVARTRFVSEDGRTRDEERSLLQVGEGRYRKVYQNVTESFVFEVDAGHRVVTPRYRVNVVARPRVEASRFWLECPDYTGIPPTPRAKPVTEPDLRVPVGTQVEYEVLASAPLASARLVFESDAPPPTGRPPRTVGPAESAERAVLEENGPPPAIHGEGKESRRKLAGKFPVTRSTRFRFAIVSTEGYDDGKKPVVFSITAVVDRPPDVKIPVPGRTRQVTPRATVPVEVEVKDDYEVASAEMRLKVEGPDGAKPEEKNPLAGIERGTKAATLKTRLDLSGMALKPGDRVTYVAVAFDRNIDVSRREGRSAPYQLIVVGQEDLQRLLQDRLVRLKDELLSTAKVEHAAREDADATVRGLAPKPKLDEGDRQRLQRVESEQRKVTSRLLNVAQELDRIIEEREQNRLGDQRELERTKDLKDTAKDLAERASPLVERELGDSRRANELDEKTKARMGRIPDLMDELENATKLLAAKIEKWGDYAEIIREVRDILSEQERVTQGTEAAIKASMGTQGR